LCTFIQKLNLISIWRGTKLPIFTKIGTKLRQIKIKDQIETKKMTRGVILTRVTVTATWHDDSLTRGNFFNFKKNQK